MYRYRGIDAYVSWTVIIMEWKPHKMQKYSLPDLEDNRWRCALGYDRNLFDDVVYALWRHQVGLKY